jgi:hypothetical protein
MYIIIPPRVKFASCVVASYACSTARALAESNSQATFVPATWGPGTIEHH